MSMTKCQCPAAGWCQTHERQMPAHKWSMCHDRPGYFEAFAATREREQEAGKPPEQRKPPKRCGCDRRKAWLNRMVPGAGDAVEAVLDATGIGGWWERRQA